MDLLIKALLGAGVVVVIGMLARSKNVYMAGLVPLFPTFALIAHYIVGSQRTTGDLKATLLFGMWSLIPYGIYLISLYYLVDRLKLVPALLTATGCWLAAAALLIVLWNRA